MCVVDAVASSVLLLCVVDDVAASVCYCFCVLLMVLQLLFGSCSFVVGVEAICW